MTQDLRIALTTSLNDRLVAPLQRSVDTVEKHLKGLANTLAGVTSQSEKANTTMMGMRGPEAAARQVAELARNTQNAVSLAEKLKSAWGVAGNTIKGVSSGIAAYQAAKYVMSGPLQAARSYDRQLADAANTAYADRSTAGRRSGMLELDAIVTSSLRRGGGKREDVMAGLNEMLASGTVNASQAKALMPEVTKYATAGNASVSELSSIVVRALQNGFQQADIPKVLDMALAAGQKGGFELKDMAKWLPKLLAAGSMSGLGGMDGYARILASAQGSVTTAGSKDEAGNNLLNLLLKINSSDTAQDAKKLGIDLSGSLAAARGKGVNSLDAFVNLVDQIAGKDSRMVALRKQASMAGNDEDRKASLNAQADILQGSAIGKIIQDRQALLPVVAELNKRSYIADVKRDVMGANGQYGSSNFDLIAGTADFRMNQQDNEKLFAQGGALGGVNDALGRLAETSTDLYRKYPAYGTVVQGATWAIGGMAAAAAAASAAFGLLSMGKVGALLGIGTTAATTAATVAGGSGLYAAGGYAPAAVATATMGATGAAAMGSVASGGLLASMFATNIVANNAKAFADMGADSGDTAFAAAIMNASQENAGSSDKELLTEVKALGQRPIQVYLDGREISASVDSHAAHQAARR